jgi:hypothetical protein
MVLRVGRRRGVRVYNSFGE